MKWKCQNKYCPGRCVIEMTAFIPVGCIYTHEYIDWRKCEEQEPRNMPIDAAQYLRRYQDWRTGKDIRTQIEAGIEPPELTEAIDTILAYFGLTKPLTDCHGCKYNGDEQGIQFVGCIKEDGCIPDQFRDATKKVRTSMSQAEEGKEE